MRPAVTLVPAGQSWLAAERAAREHEEDFVLEGQGDSMRPYLWSGSAVVVHPTSFVVLHAGMPVVYRNRAGAHVAHVLLEKQPRGWSVIGLNNREPDDELVTPRNFVGVITKVFAAADRTSTASILVVHGQASSRGQALLLKE